MQDKKEKVFEDIDNATNKEEFVDEKEVYAEIFVDYIQFFCNDNCRWRGSSKFDN